VLIRPATEADLDRILACPVTEPAGQVTSGRYHDGLARHQYRPEWTWIAEDAGRILARAIWWGFAAAAYPLALDCVDAGASTTGASTTGRTALAAEVIAARRCAGRTARPRRAMRSACRPAGGPVRRWRPLSPGGVTPLPAPG